MKLAISNIAWNDEQDDKIYQLMKKFGFSGLEIAPTRIVDDIPYDNIDLANKNLSLIKKEYGFYFPSMQSILFGKNAAIFKNKEERQEIYYYLQKAIIFAKNLNINNLVFGSPKNRIIESKEDLIIARKFFNKIGQYAFENNTIIALEPNPKIYGTNFLNTTMEAFHFVKELNNPGIKINFDIGTFIENNEKINELETIFPLINHVHLSEPFLVPIQKRKIHQEIINFLKTNQFDGFISIEMKNQNHQLETFSWTMQYLQEKCI